MLVVGLLKLSLDLLRRLAGLQSDDADGLLELGVNAPQLGVLDLGDLSKKLDVADALEINHGCDALYT